MEIDQIMTDIKQELPWYPSCFPGLQSVVGSNPTEGSSSFKKGAVLGVVDLFVVHLPFSLPHFSHMYITAEEESYLFISYKMVFLVLAPGLSPLPLHNCVGVGVLCMGIQPY